MNLPPPSPSLIDNLESAGPSVMEELARLNKAIESNESALDIAERMAARGRPVPKEELAEIVAALERTREEFAALSTMIQRRR